MKPGNIEDVYELSPTQHGMLFDVLYSADPATYLVQSSFILTGKLDVDAFKAAWRTVFERNAMLRTSFFWEQLDKPLQVVSRDAAPQWNPQDWRGLQEKERELRMEEYLREDRATGFDISRSPLMRFALFQMGDDRYHFIVTSHHLILDGWSKSLVVNEAFSCYADLMLGIEPESSSRRPYRDFITWLQGRDMAEAERYWRTMLEGISEPGRLPDFEKVCEAGESDHCATEHIKLDQAETSALIEFGRRYSCTRYTVMLGGWALLLSRCSGQRKVMFGSADAGRPSGLSGFEQMVGVFITVLPAIVEISTGEPVVEWLQRLQREQAAAREHSYFPLVKVRDWSRLPTGQALFETVLGFLNHPAVENRNLGGLTVSRGHSIERANFPLTIRISGRQETTIEALFDTTRLDRPAVQRILGYYRTVVNSLVADRHRTVDLVPLLNESERCQVVVAWNATARAYPTSCFPDLFQAQAKKTPEAAAVSCGARELTYASLEARSNQMARYLRSRGVRAEVRVGLCGERGMEMIVAILGIWKAGGALLPLDPDYPKERLVQMIKDSRAAFLLTQASRQAMFADYEGHTICLEAETDRIEQESVDALDSGLQPGNLAYVIYTSGSTGVPKGVAIEHRGLSNVTEAQRMFELGPGDRMLQFASLSFDASIFEVCMALTSGAALVMLPGDKSQFGARLVELMSKGRITAATLPPSMLAALPQAEASSLAVLTVAGEACPLSLAQRWAVGRRFWNLYGPTEGTIWATSAECTPQTAAVTIGKPIANTAAYVLSREMEPLPVGLPGELYISGEGLGRGYLCRPDLTAESFVPNPFSETPGARMYRTGDRVRLCPDGNIAFLGRNDHQVKVRGFRIELCEIETVLKTHPAVEEAAVVARKVRDDVHLTAYCKPVDDEAVDVENLRRWLAERLPSYMIPEHFLTVTRWPLTPNGKLDRNALPEPGSAVRLEPRLAPQTELERSLAEVWQQVLGVARVGLHDNFFDLGGNSIYAVQVVGMLQASYSDKIALVDLFEFPSIKTLAAHLSSHLDNDPLKTSEDRATFRMDSLAQRGSHL